MFIKKLDYLSPAITFYYKGYLAHSSITSGIFSIFSFSIMIVLGVYFSLDIIERKNPTAFYFIRYIEDSGIFPMNSSSVFHYLSLSLAPEYKDNGVDFKQFRIIGLETYLPNYSNDSNLEHYNHWIYGPCTKEKNAKGIDETLLNDYFEKSACIKKYYEKKKQKYYDIDDSEFRWPAMAHGTYNANSQFYVIILEKCQKSTLDLILGEGYECSTDDELKEIIGLSSAAHLFFVNYYVDVLNYKNPNTKFFYRIENSIQMKSYPVNHLNLNPILVKTHNGLILDKKEEQKAYIYERNDVFTFDSDDKGIYTVYYFWLSNNLCYYERTYKRIQDVISNIGGLNQAIILFATIINNLYNKFIILSDTENLLFSSINSECKLKDEKIKDKLKNIKKINKSNDIKKINVIELNNTEKSNSKINKTDFGILKGNDYNEKIKQKKNKFNKINNKDVKDNIDNKKTYTINLSKSKKLKKNFLSFLIYILTCENKNKSFHTYQNFRMKIISEEHLIRSYLNIYNLLKITRRKKSHRRNSYHLRDLIKLV